jgi:zinc and cadmium transporter
MNTGWRLTVYCSVILIASMGGGWLPLGLKPTHIRLQTYLSFASGAMLGAALCHMMPYASQMAAGTWNYWTLIGILSFIFLERFFAFHHHEARDDEPQDHVVQDSEHRQHHGHAHGPIHSPLTWRTALLGLSIHTIAGGFALASAVDAEGEKPAAVGLSVFLATLLHKPADSLTVTSLMVSEGVRPLWGHVINLCFALLIPVGVLVYFLIRATGAMSPNGYVGCALAFSAGTFLSIALGDLLPELQFHRHDRVQLSAALLGGVFLMVVSAWLE